MAIKIPKIVSNSYEAYGLLRQGINHNDTDEEVQKKIKRNFNVIGGKFQKRIQTLELRLQNQLKEKLGRLPHKEEITKEKEKNETKWQRISQFTDSLIKLQDAYNCLADRNNDPEQESSNCNVCGVLPQETLKIKGEGGKIFDTGKNLWNNKIFCYKCFLEEYKKENNISGLPQPKKNPGNPGPNPPNSKNCVICETSDNAYTYKGISICASCLCKNLKKVTRTKLEEMSGWDLLTSEEQTNFVNKINSLPSNFSSLEEGNKVVKKFFDVEHEVAVFIQNKTEHNSSVDQKRTNYIKNILQRLKNWDLLTAEEKQGFCDQINNSQPNQFETILSQAKKKIKEKQPTETDGLRKPSSPSNGDGKNNGEENHNHDEENNNNNLPQNIKSIANLPLPQSQEQAEQEIEKLLKDNGISEQELDIKNLSGESNWKDYLRSLYSPQKVAEFTYQMQQAILKKALAKKATTTENKKPKNSLVIPIVISVLLLTVLSTLIIIVRKRRQRGF